MQHTPRYGVHATNDATDAVAIATETLRLRGYAVVESGLDAAALTALRRSFDALHAVEATGPRGDLRASAGETDILRCPLARDPAFLALAANPRILAICEAMIGPGYILNQQNGITNPAGAAQYSQSPFHRDLPYQHFTSSRPLALNALFCVDDFTEENGATWVVPASHKEAAFPSEAVLLAERRQVVAPAGSFLVLDAMVWHGGGVNRSGKDRRAVNHLYSIALLRQQIDLPAYLGEAFTADPALRRLLGLQYAQPRSVEQYLTAQAAKRAAQRPR